MPDSIFSGSRSKIRWAKEHLKNLHDRWRVFETGTYLISVKQDAETGDDFLELDTSHIIPDDFLLITGDVIHNLMAALDYAMNDVEFAAINTRRRHTKFPVRNTKDELIATVNGALNDKDREQVKNFIVNDVEPYKGGKGDLIWALYHLDIEDKHRLLIAETHFTNVMGIRAKDERGQEFEIANWTIADSRIACYSCVGHRNSKITDQGKPVNTVVFGQGMPLAGRQIIPTLGMCAIKVTDIIDGIEAAFLSI
jgi:hypothetical protein